MNVFANLSVSAVSVLLCAFWVRGNTSSDRGCSRVYAALLAGCWAVLSAAVLLLDSIAVPAAATALIVGVLCLFSRETGLKQTALLSIAFGIYRLAASGAALLLSHYFFNVCKVTILLADCLILYATVVFASLFSKRWARAPIPLLQLLPVWIISVMISAVTIRGYYSSDIVILQIISFVWLLYTGILLVHVGNKLDHLEHLQMKKQQKARHYELREEYYQQLRDKQSETRALWHDLNKYLQAAKAETSSAQALHQLEKMLDSATEIVDVGNQVLNVILNEYAQTAKSKGIELQLKAQVPPKIPIATADLYILIGNTMDNAMEACEALPIEHRLIHLTLQTHNDLLYYKLVNPYTPPHVKHATGSMRGYGLANVRRCVSNYGGSVIITDENGFFTVTAHLNMDNTSENI